MIQVGLHIDVNFHIRAGNADPVTAQQWDTFAPGGCKGGGGAEGGVDKPLHCRDAALAVGVGAVARQEEGNVIAGFQLFPAQGPKAAGGALLNAARALGQRLCQRLIDGKTRGIRNKSLATILANRSAPAGIQAYFFQAPRGQGQPVAIDGMVPNFVLCR